jgi:protease-4
MRRLLPLLIICLFLISCIAAFLTTPAKNQEQRAVFQPSGIAVLDIFGPITFDTRSQSIYPTGADALLGQISEIEENMLIKGVVLRINSPGGTVGASQEVFDAILRLKETRKIPVVASIADVGASGAYYVAMASDTIFANRGSMVGSIGVIMGNINISKFSEKYGLDFVTFKSGEYKDGLSMWREPNDADIKLFQSIVDNTHAQFVADFTRERNMTIDTAHALTKGQIFTGEQALEKQLIDHVGGLHDALTFAARQAGIQGNPTIIPLSHRPFLDILSVWQKRLGASISHLFFSSPSLEFR